MERGGRGFYCAETFDKKLYPVIGSIPERLALPIQRGSESVGEPGDSYGGKGRRGRD